MAPLESEGREIDLGFLTQLHERQAEVGVQVKAAFSYFVEDGHAAEVVAPLEKRTHQAGQFGFGPDRISQRHPGARLHAVHDERGPAVVEQDGLVAKIDEERRRRRLRRDRPPHVVEIGISWHRRLVRRVADEPCERKQQQGQGRADRSPQEPRRLASQLELPPELARVLDVLERKEPQPHRSTEGTGQRRDPRGGESRVEEGGPAIERRPRPPEHDEHQEEESGFLVIEALQERRDHAGDHHDRRQVVRRIEPPGQALREDQERGAGHAAQKMRQLDDAERDERVEQLQPSRGSGRGARDQQDHSGQEGEDREHRRREPLGQPVR